MFLLRQGCGRIASLHLSFSVILPHSDPCTNIDLEIKGQIIQGTTCSLLHLRQKVIEQNPDLGKLCSCNGNCCRANQQIRKKNNHKQLVIVKTKRVTINKKRVPVANQNLILVTLHVVCVVEVIHIKVTVLLSFM